MFNICTFSVHRSGSVCASLVMFVTDNADFPKKSTIVVFVIKTYCDFCDI